MIRLEPLAIKNVTPHVITEPHGIDMVCKSLQSNFAAIPWLEKSFARAVFRTEQREQEYVYPAMFVAAGYDYLDMLQIDNWKSYSFMIARDSETFEDYQEGIENTITRRLSCMFWMNLELVDPTRQDDFLEELKRDVIKSIKSTRFLDVTGGAKVMGIEIQNIYDEPKNVFNGFTMSATESKFLYYPYRGLRVDLKCYYTEEC